MSEHEVENLEESAFVAVERLIGINRDVYVTQVKLEVAREYGGDAQVSALQNKLVELLQENRRIMFDLLEAVMRVGEQGKRSRRFMELYRELLNQVKDPNNVSLFPTRPTEQAE